MWRWHSWNDAELVNTHGEVFAAESDQALPKFIGQPETAAEITPDVQGIRRTARAAQAGGGANQPVAASCLAVALEQRHGAGTGARTGARAFGALRGGLSVQPGILPHTVNYVDLRYRNGFAAYLPGGIAKWTSQSELEQKS